MELRGALTAALKAGREIMEVYAGKDFTLWSKEDKSPLTEADIRSHSIIVEELLSFKYPILSEEGRDIPYQERKEWKKFWLIDPLDGTKEFLKRNGEFTVNIALIEARRPVMGIVYAPALELLYFATPEGAYRAEGVLPELPLKEVFERAELLPSVPPEEGKIRVVASRSHLSKETEEFVERLKERGEVDFLSVGSSLKLCFVAEGKADLYPRYAPTMEWDTAAGQAVVEASGGKVLEAETLTPLVYNKENLLNPYFIAVRRGYGL
jgi:3'(2'), 5'-bisphosphate nucleotidase